MKLPINMFPSINSYVQHSYPNAIIESHELLTLYVNDIDKYIWKANSKDIDYRINDNYLYVYEKDSNRTDTDFYIKRDCQIEDEIIVMSEYFKRTDNLAYIEIFLTANQEGKEDIRLYSLRWNRYDIHVNDTPFAYDMNKYRYFKVVRKGTNIFAYISMNNTAWELVESYENQEIDKCITYDLFTCVFWSKSIFRLEVYELPAIILLRY